MTSISVVIPIFNGQRYLDEVLTAVSKEAQEAAIKLQIVVVDSGSSDGSLETAQRHSVELLQIDKKDFSHGRTRNLAAEICQGDLICFLTQDATPAPGWLKAYLDAFQLSDRVGAAFGPHLARKDTSPMIARELSEFFKGFSADNSPSIQKAGDEPFISNVNACYRKTCFDEIKFRDLDYAEDQAFGRDLLARGYEKVYHPDAAVYHAHDYSPLRFIQRYFDEYRGLAETTKHREQLNRDVLRDILSQVQADRKWLKDNQTSSLQTARWTARSVLHHGGRKFSALLGSRADRLPPSLEQALSLEGRSSTKDQTPPDSPPNLVHVPAKFTSPQYEDILNYYREGRRELKALKSVPTSGDSLHIATVVPPYSRGSGGHGTLFKLLSGLEALGHTCSVWIADPFDEMQETDPAKLKEQIKDFFTPLNANVHRNFSDWKGSDVVLATGWQTVYPALQLDNCSARAYLVQDYEPAFYPTSPEAIWAELTYDQGLFCICASPWLRDLLKTKHGTSGSYFTLGVDRSKYFTEPTSKRSKNRVAVYARASTPRRAVDLATLALDELERIHPGCEVVMYGGDPGDWKVPRLSTPYKHLGIINPSQLAQLYRESTVGLCLSLTNYSLVPQEMMACGLPCVDLAGFSGESVFGKDGPLTLAEADPVVLAEAIDNLLIDHDLWQKRSTQGIDFVENNTWEKATNQVNSAIYEALQQQQKALAIR